MRKLGVVIILVIFSISLFGCSNKFESAPEPTGDYGSDGNTVLAELAEEAKEPKTLSSDYYPMDRAMIESFKSKNFDVEVIEWEFIGEDTIYILDKDGREFIVDKSNVTFFSSPLS